MVVTKINKIKDLTEKLEYTEPGIIEFGRLPDDDRAGTDQQDTLDVSALRHAPPRPTPPPTNAWVSTRSPGEGGLHPPPGA